MTESKVTLYRLYNQDGVLLYVGASKYVRSRVASHVKHKQWGRDVDESRTVVEGFETGKDASRAELSAIRDEVPIYNLAGVSLPYVPAGGRYRRPDGGGNDGLSQFVGCGKELRFARAAAIRQARSENMTWREIAERIDMTEHGVVKASKKAQPPA